MGIRLTKPWIELDGLDRELLPGQLGVFELGAADGRVVYLGYAGGRTAFGLRTAIEDAIEDLGAQDPADRPAAVRWELTHGYLSRWEELMMVHVHDHGGPPAGNDPAEVPPGRVTPIETGPPPSTPTAPAGSA